MVTVFSWNKEIIIIIIIIIIVVIIIMNNMDMCSVAMKQT